MSDPIVKMVRREIDDALNRGGMQAGSPKVSLDISHVAAICNTVDKREREISDLREEIDRLTSSRRHIAVRALRMALVSSRLINAIENIDGDLEAVGGLNEVNDIADELYDLIRPKE